MGTMYFFSLGETRKGAEIESTAGKRFLEQVRLPTLNEFELGPEQLRIFDRKIVELMERIEGDRSSSMERLANELSSFLRDLRILVYECEVEGESVHWTVVN